MKLSAIYCITKPDSLENHKGGNLFEKMEFLLSSGVHTIQLRDKSIPIEQYKRQIQNYKPLFVKHQAQLIVNDHISVAIEEGVGLHIGWEDLQNYAHIEKLSITEALSQIRAQIHSHALLGLTVHNDLMLIKKVSHLVDYVGVGPIFSTTTKLDAKNILGVDSLRDICSETDVPVVAVGGIKESNLCQLLDTGASQFAICSDIFGAVNISQKMHGISKILQGESSECIS